MKRCQVSDCTRRHAAKGYCIMHYNRWRRTGNPLAAQRMVPRGSSVAERLDIVLDRSGGPDACHLFTGAVNRTGYGYLKIDGITRGVHVWAFLDAGGTLTEDKPLVLHSCDVRACANTRYLRAGDLQDNMDDKVARGRQYRPSRRVGAEAVAS